MGTTDEAARVVTNLVRIVYGLVLLGFVGCCGYLIVSCVSGN